MAITVESVVAKIKGGALGEGYSVREESLSSDGYDNAKLHLTRYGSRRCGYIIVRGDLIDAPGEIDASAAKIAGMSESSVVEVLS